MARRKIGKTHHRRKAAAPRRRRSRRVSGLNVGGAAMTVLGLVGGSIAARELSNIVKKQFPSVSDTVIGAGQILVGVMLPKFVKAKLAQDVANGMIAFGGQVVAVNLGIIAGPNDRMSYRIGAGGTANLRAINGGTPYLKAVSGVTPKPIASYARRNAPGNHLATQV